jgi:hypothetical protein
MSMNESGNSNPARRVLPTDQRLDGQDVASPHVDLRQMMEQKASLSSTIGNAFRYRSGRSCIDDHFAMLEATLDPITFIENAELNSLDYEFPLAATFTLMAGGPICARIRWRDRAPRR